MSWAGCGRHVPSAMANIPPEEWCTCVEKDGSRGAYPPASGKGRSLDGRVAPPPLVWSVLAPYAVPCAALVGAAAFLYMRTLSEKSE